MNQPPTPQSPATPGPGPQVATPGPGPHISLPRQEISVKSQVGNLVVLCNDHIAHYHEYMFADAGELITELILFRTDFENVYLNTNLYILYTKPGMEIPVENKPDGKTVSFLELCGDLDTWFSFAEYENDPAPNNAFEDGEILCRQYQKALIIAGLYNPAEV